MPKWHISRMLTELTLGKGADSPVSDRISPCSPGGVRHRGAGHPSPLKMPSIAHEAIVDFFRERPQLAAELLAALGLLAPGAPVTATPAPADLSESRPAAFFCDCLILLEGATRLAVIVEVQLRPDPDKPWTWPAYVSVARARYRCPVVVLVVTLDAATARWAARPIALGPGSLLTPVVIGPDRVPLIVDEDAARRAPELSVLSALAHGHGPAAEQVGLAALSAAVDLDDRRMRQYTDLVLEALRPDARALLEAFMLENWTPRSDFLRRMYAEAEELTRQAALKEGIERGIERGIEKGIEKGEARGVERGQRALLLRQLRRRFGALPTAVEDRVNAAHTADLERWADRLIVGLPLAALFDEADEAK